MRLLPTAEVGFLGMVRNEETLRGLDVRRAAARRPVRAAVLRARPDAGHRRHPRGRDPVPHRPRRRPHHRDLPARRARGLRPARAGPRRASTSRSPSSPPRSTSSSTRRATSSPASATPATGSTAWPSSRRVLAGPLGRGLQHVVVEAAIHLEHQHPAVRRRAGPGRDPEGAAHGAQVDVRETRPSSRRGTDPQRRIAAAHVGERPVVMRQRPVGLEGAQALATRAAADPDSRPGSKRARWWCRRRGWCWDRARRGGDVVRRSARRRSQLSLDSMPACDAGSATRPLPECGRIAGRRRSVLHRLGVVCWRPRHAGAGSAHDRRPGSAAREDRDGAGGDQQRERRPPPSPGRRTRPPC